MKTHHILGIILIAALLMLTACSNNDNTPNISDEQSSSLKAKPTGGEKLESVRAEYSFCYSTDNYDPTLATECEENITYKQCLEWKEKQAGQASTFFYAIFQGGEPTTVGRNANEYYMKVKYGEGLEARDEIVAFPNIKSTFDAYDLTDCYPIATIEIYNMQDELMGKMSLDNTEN